MNFSSLPDAAARMRAGRGATWRGWLVAVLLGVGAGWPLFAADAPAKAKPEMHLFTDTSDNSLLAQIVEVAEPDVFLSRADGFPFRVKISVFSKADQEYIRQWAQTHRARDTFRISIMPDHTGAANPDGPARPNLPDGYKVTLNNQTDADLADLNIRYIIFKRLPGGTKDIGALPRQNGVIKVDKLAIATDLSFETDRVITMPMGLWVRIYDQKGNLLQELASSPEIIKTVTWDFADPLNPANSASKNGAAVPGAQFDSDLVKVPLAPAFTPAR